MSLDLCSAVKSGGVRSGRVSLGLVRYLLGSLLRDAIKCGWMWYSRVSSSRVWLDIVRLSGVRYPPKSCLWGIINKMLWGGVESGAVRFGGFR